MHAPRVIAASLVAFAGLGSLALTAHQPAAGAAQDGAVEADADGARATVESLGFLEGRWTGSLGPNTIEEDWMPVRHGNVTSSFRMFDGAGNLAMVELIVITKGTDDQPATLRMRHFDAKLTPWASEASGPYEAALSSVEGTKATFTATKPTEALRTIVYDGSADGKLTVTLGFDEKSGRPPLVIVYDRAED